MKGVFVTKTTRELKDFPIPKPGAGEVLVKSRSFIMVEGTGISADRVRSDVVVASNPKGSPHSMTRKA